MWLGSIPNILTGCNLSAGILAIYLSGKGRIGISSALVLVSIIFDGLDGWIARRLKSESAFGRLFDSAADFVSFALAPSFICYYLIRKNDALILSAISVYIFASAVRLIRFNNLSKSGLIKNFEGLPTTASAGLLMFLTLLFPEYLKQPLFSMATFTILSVLMLSRIHFWKFNR